MIANTSSPYAFDLLELKGSDLRREPIEAERRRHPDGLRGPSQA
jgi:ATP-dependent DNA ligase